MKTREYNTAVILSAGKGRRMQSDVPKQYLPLKNRPVLSWSLQQFQNAPEVQEIVLVTGGEEVDYCRERIVIPGGFTKVRSIIPGGAQRYNSVYAALNEISTGLLEGTFPACDYVLIHDGARPLIDQELIERNLACARANGCAVTGVPVKDTIKLCSGEGVVEATPPRPRLWQVQTPQTFLFHELKTAYDRLFSQERMEGVTDDAMVMEQAKIRPVYMCEGSYRNIKITTREDLQTAELFVDCTTLA